MWAMWSTHWFVGIVLLAVSEGLIRSGNTLFRGGRWLRLNLVPISDFIVKTHRPDYVPLTDEQRIHLDSLYDQLVMYLQQMDEVGAAMDATTGEIEYYKRQYNIKV